MLDRPYLSHLNICQKIRIVNVKVRFIEIVLILAYASHSN